MIGDLEYLVGRIRELEDRYYKLQESYYLLIDSYEKLRYNNSEHAEVLKENNEDRS